MLNKGKEQQFRSAIGKNNYLQFALVQIAIGSDEDRFSTFLDHKIDNIEDISSFGVFDGHHGSHAADFSSVNLHRIIMQRYSRLRTLNKKLKSENDMVLENDSKYTQLDNTIENNKKEENCKLNSSEELDAMFVESCVRGCDYVDRRLQNMTEAGTTMISLFLRHDPSDDSITAYCGNIGDSRCVMTFSNDSPYDSNISELKRNSFSYIPPKLSNLPQQQPNLPIGEDINASTHSAISINTEATTSNLRPVSGSSSIDSQRSIKRSILVVPMSEDHSLSLPRERMRIEQRTPIPLYSLPLSAYNDSNTSSQLFMAADNFITSLVQELHKNSEIDAKFFNSQLSDPFEYDDENQLSELAERAKSIEFHEPDYLLKGDSQHTEVSVIKLQRQDTMISNRKGNFGSPGPEALFSRYNVSILMTRSLGDRYGPRSCRGLPDVRILTIPKNRHVRFILASDGVSI